MELIKTQLPVNYNLFLVGDAHVGSILHYEKGFQSMLHDVMSEKNNYVCLTGDLIEAICVDDKRFSPETVEASMLTPISQSNYICKLLEPIKERILVVLEGNHELKLQRVGNITRDLICASLFGESKKTKHYGTYSCKLIVSDKKGTLMHKIFLTHGYGTLSSVADDPIRRESNMKLSLKRRLQYKAGDCILQSMSHCHQLLVVEPTKELYLTDDGDELKQHYTHAGSEDFRIPENLRFYCATGSFLKTFHVGATSYSERFGYNPAELGYIKVEIHDKEITSVRKVII